MTETPTPVMTEDAMRDLVKDCGLDWQRGYMPLFDGDPTNRYAVLIESAQAAALEAQAAQIEALRADAERLKEDVKAARYRSMVEGRISYRGYSYGMGSQSGIDDLRRAIERDKAY